MNLRMALSHTMLWVGSLLCTILLLSSPNPLTQSTPLSHPSQVMGHWVQDAEGGHLTFHIQLSGPARLRLHIHPSESQPSCSPWSSPVFFASQEQFYRVSVDTETSLSLSTCQYEWELLLPDGDGDGDGDVDSCAYEDDLRPYSHESNQPPVVMSFRVVSAGTSRTTGTLSGHPRA